MTARCPWGSHFHISVQSTQGPLSCDPGDRAHLPAGVVQGLPKVSLIFGLREVSRTGMGANIPAAGKRSVSMANHCFCSCRDGSLLWTVNPILCRFHHHQSVPLSRATYYCCSVNTSLEAATELETYSWSCLREQTCPEIVTVKVVNGLDTSG